MEENVDEEIDEEPEDISEDILEEEVSEEVGEEISETSDEVVKTDEGESIEEIEQDSEGLTNEESIEEQTIETDANSTEGSLDSTVLDEKSLELETKALQRNFIEAALYASGGPLTIEELSHKLEFPKKEVEILVNELAFDYLERNTALVINQVGEAYQMGLRPEYVERVSKFAKGGGIAERYLRTLTVIALKQPILKSMVIKLRGTGAYEHVKYLLDNGFIDAVKKGRSQELTTTDKYADMFGLPRDKRQMKSRMISQLGLGEGGQIEPSGEIEEEDLSESPEEIEDVSQNDSISNVKEEE